MERTEDLHEVCLATKTLCTHLKGRNLLKELWADTGALIQMKSGPGRSLFGRNKGGTDEPLHIPGLPTAPAGGQEGERRVHVGGPHNNRFRSGLLGHIESADSEAGD